MKKFALSQFMGIIATMATLILSLTVYAYARDLSHVDTKINTEITDRKTADSVLNAKIKEKISNSEFQEYKDGIKTLLEYIQANDKEKRMLELKIIELTK